MIITTTATAHGVEINKYGWKGGFILTRQQIHTVTASFCCCFGISSTWGLHILMICTKQPLIIVTENAVFSLDNSHLSIVPHASTWWCLIHVIWEDIRKTHPKVRRVMVRDVSQGSRMKEILSKEDTEKANGRKQWKEGKRERDDVNDSHWYIQCQG